MTAAGGRINGKKKIRENLMLSVSELVIFGKSFGIVKYNLYFII